MDKSLINTNIEQQFTEVVNLIVQHRSKASMAVNKEMLLTAWHVGAYVSKKLKVRNGEARSFPNYLNISVLNILR